MGTIITILQILHFTISSNVINSNANFIWGSEDTSLTFAQTFYYWGIYKNESKISELLFDRERTKISFFLKVDSEEIKLADSYFSDNPNDRMLKSNSSRFVLRGTSTHYKLSNILAPVKAQIVVRSFGIFRIDDSVMNVMILPVEREDAKKWLFTFDDKISSLNAATSIDYESKLRKKSGICKEMLTEYYKLKCSSSNLTFEPYLREKINFNCGRIVNNNGVSNRNWKIFRDITSCSVTGEINPSNLSQSCEFAYISRNRFITSKIHSKMKLSSQSRVIHRFLTNLDTVEVLEGTWYGNLKGEQ